MAEHRVDALGTVGLVNDDVFEGELLERRLFDEAHFVGGQV